MGTNVMMVVLWLGKLGGGIEGEEGEGTGGSFGDATATVVPLEDGQSR